jgi:hypothetical protein
MVFIELLTYLFLSHLFRKTLVALFGIIDANPMMHHQFFAPQPLNLMMMRPQPQHLIPNTGMRMLSGSYKPSTPAYSPSNSPAYPPAHHASPYSPPHSPYGHGYGGYGPLNIHNNNGNENMNYNSDDAASRGHESGYNAQVNQNSELNDILAAYSLQSFLQSSRPVVKHREYTTKYSSSIDKAKENIHKKTTEHKHKENKHKEYKHKEYTPTPTKPDYTPKQHYGY